MSRTNLVLASFSAALVAFLVPRAAAQCGEAPSDFCSSARVIPGAPGVYEVTMDVHNATAVGESLCGIPVGHTVWFSVTPTVTGLLTFSTCHPNTTYDTVIAAWSGGESSCEFISLIACNDDTTSAVCSNGCSAYSSTLTFPVTAGVRYRFCVGSYNSNSAGCNLCLGVRVTICDPTMNPPSTSFLSPGGLGCVCTVSHIYGTAEQPGGGLAGWTLEVAPAAGGSWIPISSGTSSIVNSYLGTWDATGLPEGYYTLRLTATNPCLLTSSAIRTVWLDQQMDSTILRAPATGQVVGGTVCADGTAWDHCGGSYALAHRALPSGVLYPFDTLNPPWILNDPLGTWNTHNSPDGFYEIQLTTSDVCSNTGSATSTIELDNTAPTAVISSPIACSEVNGMVSITGTANDAHLAVWTLSFTGGPFTSWQMIAFGGTPVVGGVLGSWDTRGLPDCEYALRLTATDSSILSCNGALHNESEYIVTVRLGAETPCIGDLNGDRAVDLTDLAQLLSRYGLICP